MLESALILILTASNVLAKVPSNYNINDPNLADHKMNCDISDDRSVEEKHPQLPKRVLSEFQTAQLLENNHSLSPQQVEPEQKTEQ